MYTIVHGHSSNHRLYKLTENRYEARDVSRIVGSLDDIKAIDFDGGPMLGISSKVDGRSIISIVYDFSSAKFIINVE